MPKLEPYNRKLNYSYALGVFPSLMLMEAHPEKIQRLLLHPDGLKNEGVIKLRDMCARRPKDALDFLEVNGVGSRKLERYGEAFLDAIAKFEAGE